MILYFDDEYFTWILPGKVTEIIYTLLHKDAMIFIQLNSFCHSITAYDFLNPIAWKYIILLH